jgi:hypothetical protein
MKGYSIRGDAVNSLLGLCAFRGFYQVCCLIFSHGSQISMTSYTIQQHYIPHERFEGMVISRELTANSTPLDFSLSQINSDKPQSTDVNVLKVNIKPSSKIRRIYSM